MAGSDVRIVLLGKSSVDKTLSLNTILGTEDFVMMQSSPQYYFSRRMQCRKFETKVAGRKVLVADQPESFDKFFATFFDTPRFFNEPLTNEQMNREMYKCVYMTVPGPHVFLLVVRLGRRYTLEQNMALRWIQETFSKLALYTLVLFTCDTMLDTIDIPVKDYIEKSPDLQQLISECQGRYHTFDNKNKDRTQVTDLLAKIDRMVAANGGHYTDELYLEAQIKIQEEERKRREEEMKRQEEERKRQEEERKKEEAMKKEWERQEKQRREEDRKWFEEENRQRLEEERKRREEDRREYERRRNEDRQWYEEQERKRREEERQHRAEEKKEWERRREEEKREEERKREEEKREERKPEEEKREEERKPTERPIAWPRALWKSLRRVTKRKK